MTTEIHHLVKGPEIVTVVLDLEFGTSSIRTSKGRTHSDLVAGRAHIDHLIREGFTSV